MRRALPGGYELDDDPARIDVDYVFNYLTLEAYWALGRPREVVERSLAGSARVVGLYHAGAQVGFARVVSDGAVFAYLADVFVDSAHRSRGLGLELAREAVDGGPHRNLSWLLGTSDAQGLYAKLGFHERVTPPSMMERRARPRGSAARLVAVDIDLDAPEHPSGDRHCTRRESRPGSQ